MKKTTYWQKRLGKSRLLIFALLILAFALPLTIINGFATKQTRQLAAGTAVQVTLNPATTTQTIAPDFMGDSVEPWRLCDLKNYDQASPASAALFKTLGLGHIRLGGASADYTTWSPTGTPSCSFNGTVITQSSIAELFSFANKAGKKVTFILNLKTGTPADDAAEARYASQVGGTTLQAFELGNEPDLYGESYAQYKTQWETIYNAVHAAVPNVPVIGPSISNQVGFLTSFLNDESSKISLATAHPYPLFSGNNPGPTDTISASTMSRLLSNIDNYVNAAKTKNLSVDLNETNAVANTPPASVGAAYDMSLWGADYTFSAAEHGVVAMEFHGAIPGDETSPFNGTGTTPGIRPLYYGMLLFHYAVPNGGKVIPVQSNATINLTSHAVLRSDGKVAVVLVNKDLSNGATVTINTTQSYSSATAVRLSAPSLTSAVGAISLGGSQVNTNTGTWTPTTLEPITTNGATASLSVPALSAVVVLFDNGTGTPPSQPTPTPITPSYVCAGSQNNICPSGIPINTPTGSQPSSIPSSIPSVIAPSPCTTAQSVTAMQQVTARRKHHHRNNNNNGGSSNSSLIGQLLDILRQLINLIEQLIGTTPPQPTPSPTPTPPAPSILPTSMPCPKAIPTTIMSMAPSTTLPTVVPTTSVSNIPSPSGIMLTATPILSLAPSTLTPTPTQPGSLPTSTPTLSSAPTPTIFVNPSTLPSQTLSQTPTAAPSLSPSQTPQPTTPPSNDNPTLQLLKTLLEIITKIIDLFLALLKKL